MNIEGIQIEKTSEVISFNQLREFIREQLSQSPTAEQARLLSALNERFGLGLEI